MKRFIFLVTFLMQVTISASGQSTDEKGVRKTLDELTSALKKQDIAEFDRIFAMDYTFISPSGVLFNKSERIAALKSEKPYEYFAYEDKNFRFYGNTAVVTTTVKNKYAGQDAIHGKTMLVMVKNNGRWQVVAAQATLIPPAK
jgi:hypothetical protein